MDFRGRDQTWLTQIDSIFKCTARNGEVESGQIKESKEKVRILLRKRMRLWWNKVSLENYLSKGLIPRGLRVQVFPSFPMEDPIFKNKWEENCSNCSRVMMQLLIGLNKKDLETLESEIEGARDKLVEILTPSQLDIFKTEMESQYASWEKEIQEFKMKKFQRDLQDMQNNKMYKWHHGFERRRKPIRTNSISSISSMGSSSSISQQGDGGTHRNGKRKGDYDTKQQQDRKRNPSSAQNKLQR